MRRKRQTNVFSLAFLDVMSCGFGAVVLIFLIINHNSQDQPPQDDDLLTQLRLLDFEVLRGQEELYALVEDAENTQAQLANTATERAAKEAELAKLIEQLQEVEGLSLAEIAAAAKLRSDIESRKTEVKRLQALERANAGSDLRVIEGEGDRQYLTGMRIGGRNIVIAIDVSASMLDETVVNIIRRRNMSDEKQRSAPKWQRAIRTVEWLAAQLPLDAEFQIYRFNETVATLATSQSMEWLAMDDGTELNAAVNTLKTQTPSGGTNLEALVLAMRDLSPIPDSVYIITDGLPTRDDKTPRQATVSGRERLDFFRDAANRLPRQIPVNVILFPMEGDPMAGAAWWQLARATGGAFISPSWDWP
jgi:hypothetical protein